jgi:hypothetical protein
VVAAEEGEVVGFGFSSVCPMVDVVDVAPSGPSVAASLPGAVAVSGDDGPSQGRGDDPGLSADVDDLTGGSEDDPAHRGVACECSDLGESQDMPVFVLVETAGNARQRFEITDHVR